MKKNLIYCGFLALILAMALVLSVGILMNGPSEAGANEKLSVAPVLFDEEGVLNDQYLSDAAAWLNDHFFGRQELISINNRLSSFLQTSGEDSVILGKDGWLFYASTLSDYTGEDTMTGRELFCAANNLRLMAQYCESQGKDFAFMIAPNKNSLYPENMPDYGVISTLHDARKLHMLLDEMGVPYIDLFTAFRSQEEVLYFVTDSHWNSKGAALGADLVNAAFGIDSSYFADGSFTEFTPYTGDLYEMLYPAFAGTELQPVYGGALQFAYSGKATRPDSITLLTAGQGETDLLCYRDSFGNLLYPYLADSYADARFSRSNTYDITPEADHVLIELVERNLRYLISNAPVMPSPAVSLTLPKGYAGTAAVTHEPKTRTPEGCGAWTGTLPETGEKATAYLLWDGQCYEAFLMENNAFTVYLPEDASPEALVIQNGEATQVYTIQ